MSKRFRGWISILFTAHPLLICQLKVEIENI
jgi:hypothetical protein